MHNSSDLLVWVDCEMTGLDVSRDALLEIAIVVSGFDLQPQGDGLEIVMTPGPEALDAMSPVVCAMHTSSGLLDRLEYGLPLEEAATRALTYVKTYVPAGTKAFLAGNSVGMDRAFLLRDMPEVLGLLHYRVLDVSTVKELALHWSPQVAAGAPKKAGGHRALADIMESIAELRYYREHFFTSDPVPRCN